MKIRFILLAFLSVFTLTACNDVNENENPDHISYFGKGSEWFGTYTISKVNNSYFDSLYIQYVQDRANPGTEQTMEELGQIEYVLDTGNSVLESSSPLPLEGIGSFHTATEFNAEMFEMDYPDEITLTVKWQDQNEVIQLNRQN
ncbi:hypothetical protein [Lysinibacillus antri]|uniref:DUF4825 domain-containing protein n=1 Tax=Lysinibacillus antri TaxID=2498145 RepID=A0A432LC84_9BACI|nr:hypothetical protein [Lysinibacillus antri]RUL52248.1 hypothetical protein EK386_10375 [Lysinibacillus antri]